MRAKKGVDDSEFHMWRAVFAFSLVDNVLSLEEQKMLQIYFKQVPFSNEQIATLKNDFLRPQNIEEMYKKIVHPEHKARFCALARALSWCEGDMDRQEEQILKKLSCIKGTPDYDILRKSREAPDLETLYKSYAQAGLIGFFKPQPSIRMRA